MYQTIFTRIKMLCTSQQLIRTVSLSVLVMAFMGIIVPEMANAALPWESPIRQIAASFCGPVAKGIGICALVGAGLMIAFGEVKGWIHNMMVVLIGISIAVLAPSFLTMLGVVSLVACN